MSNSKSEDTCDFTPDEANLCAKCGYGEWRHDSLKHPCNVFEPSQDTCDCLCHNPDALKWGCEHCAMPPQDTTIQDVVNGTPKGQEAVRKAMEQSIQDQNKYWRSQFRDILGDSNALDVSYAIPYLFAQIAPLPKTRNEHDRQTRKINELAFAIDDYIAHQRAKLFEQIRSEAELYNVKSINGEIVKPNTGILAIPLEALTRLESEQ